jgi:hypothetical protein
MYLILQAGIHLVLGMYGRCLEALVESVLLVPMESGQTQEQLGPMETGQIQVLLAPMESGQNQAQFT